MCKQTCQSCVSKGRETLSKARASILPAIMWQPHSVYFRKTSLRHCFCNYCYDVRPPSSKLDWIKSKRQERDNQAAVRTNCAFIDRWRHACSWPSGHVVLTGTTGSGADEA